jgi:hypothetical protein
MLAAGVEAMAAAAAKSDWQSEWEKTLAAATKVRGFGVRQTLLTYSQQTK